MKIILTAILPVFLIIVLGGIAQRKNLLGENSVTVLNRFVFYFAFPPLLFVIMAEQPLKTILNFPFIGAMLAGLLGTFFLSMLIFSRLSPASLSTESLRAQAASFPNTGYIGLPIVMAMYGAPALLPMGVAIILCMFVFATSMVLIEIDRFRGEGAWLTFKKVALTISKNPVIVAPILGIFYAAFGLPLPIALKSFCHQLGAAAAPCALFAIGLSLAAEKLQTNWQEVGGVNFIKLIIQPLLTLLFMWWFKVTPLWAIVGVIAASIPTAATIFMVAKQYNIYEKHAASIIFYGTIFSLVSITVFALLAARIWSI